MKTIKQWFETFEDAEIRKRALENLEKYYWKSEPNPIVTDIYGVIPNAFNWEITPEGYDFWLEISAFNNPASVKFDEVKHLIKND